jgi:hypothetical protein
MKLAREVGAGIGCAEMLGQTKYIALVGGGKAPKFPQNKVIIWDDSKQGVVMTLEFKTPVQRVRLSKSHIVVVLLNSVNVYDWAMPPKKIAAYETINNPFGLCSLGTRTLAIPGISAGQVRLVDLQTTLVNLIPAHMSPLMAIELSREGDILATASESGTLIRVWSVEHCTKICELRRGLDPATIFSLAISPDASLLAVTSDKSTLHIFDLPGRASALSRSSRDAVGSGAESDPKLNKWGILSQVPLLPRTFSDTYSFATAHFELGDEPSGWGAATRSPTYAAPIPGVPGGRPTKGLIGWLDNEHLIVLGAGHDARWEKFIVGVAQDGKRVCMREGWKKYLES